MRFSDLVPKTVVCFKEGYSRERFFGDLFAGLSVGVIAIPLSLAFAIASGLDPERGLATAVVGGLLISLFSGSRVQIGGPAGAFVILVYSIVQRHGYEGLLLSMLIASVLLILMGLFRFGVFLRFIPYPVTTGFTTGIALTILLSQVKDFLGLEVAQVPVDVIGKCSVLCQFAHTWRGPAVFIALGSLLLIWGLRRRWPRFPGMLAAIIAATALAWVLKLPVETISSKFGEIPRLLPVPSLPVWNGELIQAVFPDAITVALLCAIESLLCAVVADGLTGQRHRPNSELIAQGIGNLGSALFGGMPATGTIARTSANIRLGGKTPVAGIIHALTVLLIMLLFAPFASQIPLAALAAVIVFVALNMLELPHFIEILRGQKGDAAVLLTTFLLTVLVDLTVAVQVGVVLAAVIFLKRMTDRTSVEICQMLVKENQRETPQTPSKETLPHPPAGVSVFEIRGPFFYSVADLLDETLARLSPAPQTFWLKVDKMPLIDATGLKAMKHFAHKCKQKGIRFVVSGASKEVQKQFEDAGVDKAIGKEHLFSSVEDALEGL